MKISIPFTYQSFEKSTIRINKTQNIFSQNYMLFFFGNICNSMFPKSILQETTQTSFISIINNIISILSQRMRRGKIFQKFSFLGKLIEKRKKNNIFFVALFQFIIYIFAIDILVSLFRCLRKHDEKGIRCKS